MPVHAADIIINTNGTYDTADYGNDSTVTINGGLTVTLTNNTGNTYTDIQIDCTGENTALTIIATAGGMSDICKVTVKYKPEPDATYHR